MLRPVVESDERLLKLYESGEVLWKLRISKRVISALLDSTLRLGCVEVVAVMWCAGLPSWAIYMPSYGFVYRPWFRTVTWNLFICISVFSLLSGFYGALKPEVDLTSDNALRGHAVCVLDRSAMLGTDHDTIVVYDRVQICTGTRRCSLGCCPVCTCRHWHCARGLTDMSSFGCPFC